jgi:hypothetical protein
MKDYVSFQQPDGSRIVVEVDEGEHGLSRAARRTDGIVAESGRRFDEMIDNVRPMASTVVEKLRAGDSSLSEVTLEFGLKLTFSAGAVIASSSGEGTFKVTMKWDRDAQ